MVGDILVNGSSIFGELSLGSVLGEKVLEVGSLCGEGNALQAW